MNAQRAITLAGAVGGRVFSPGENVWHVHIDRGDGAVICICDDYVTEFASKADFASDTVARRIALSPKTTGLLFDG